MRAYVAMPWDDGQIKLYRDCLKRLVSECGETRVARAVENTILNETFLEVAKIKNHMPSNMFHASVNPGCLDCNGSGWQPVAVVNPENRVKRCHCRRVIGQ